MSRVFDENEPVLMLDGKLGIVIRFPTSNYNEYGIQVPDEESIRWRSVENFSDDPLPHEIE